jgi:isocitrate dehydrogenase
MVDSKIKVDGVVVDLDGDEMTRIIWDLIKRKVSLVFLNLVNISIFRRNL